MEAFTTKLVNLGGVMRPVNVYPANCAFGYTPTHSTTIGGVKYEAPDAEGTTEEDIHGDSSSSISNDRSDG